MYEIKGLDAFEKSLLKALEVKYPQEVIKELSKLAGELMDNAKDKTRLGDKEFYYYKGKKVKVTASKRMKNRWKVGKPKQIKGEWYIEVYNTAPHAHLFEDGHRMVTPGGEMVGFVQGKHILYISVKQFEEKLTPKLQGWLNKMLEEYSI